MARVFHEEDADPAALSGEKIAVIGYGNQGRVQALNLRDRGLEVCIGNREDEFGLQARADGFQVFPIPEATAKAQVVMLLIPDEVMPEVYEREVAPRLGAGALLCFASGYGVGFGQIHPRSDLDVVMIAPRMFGPGVREEFLAGRGFASFLAVHQDATGRAWPRLLALAHAVGALGRGGLELSMKEEAELDLFTEQAFGPAFGAVLMTAIQLLVDEGYPVEAVLMELFMSGEFEYALHRMTHEGVIEQMSHHSHTSQYGSMTRAGRFLSLPLREKMALSLEEIRSGQFVEEWKKEQEAGLPTFKKLLELRKLHPLLAWQKQTRQAFRFPEFPSPQKAPP